MNYSIVYNGLQHYESCDFFGGDTGFKKRKILDNIKREYCNNNNIRLEVISYYYNSIKRIKEKLIKIFNEKN